MRCSIAVSGVLALFLMGCGSTHDAGKLPSSYELLTADEMSTTSALTADEAIRMRRPAYLRKQGPKTVVTTYRSTMYPVVYLNGVYYGDVESLKSLYVSDIRDIRYIEPKEATIMFGTGHVAGVIMVNTKNN